MAKPISASTGLAIRRSQKHPWVAALAALVMVSIAPIASAQDCNHNGILDYLEQYQAVHYQSGLFGGADFGQLPFPTGDVVITYSIANREFVSDSSYISVSVNGVVLGNVLENITTRQCKNWVGTLTVPRSDWLAAVGPTGEVFATSTLAGIQASCGAAYFPTIAFDYDIDADCDGDGLLNACDFDGCASGGFNNTCYPDTDGDGVADPCDQCEGSDDTIDSDGDGVPDGCDVCANADDKQDCNLNGVPDCLETSTSTTFYNEWGFTDELPCNGASLTLADLPLPASTGDVTFVLNCPLPTFVNEGDAVALYGNNVFLGNLYENVANCAASDTLVIPEATWNSATQAGNGSLDLELRMPVDACPTFCGILPDLIFSNITYTPNYDTNDNGTDDFCPADCAYTATDTDGDHVPDDCDQCPGTIPGHPYVNEVGCPYFIARADLDGDGDVDGSDFVGFFGCDTGPGVNTGDGCDFYDYTSNGEVDLLDYLALQDAASGPDVFAELEAMGYHQPDYVLMDEYTNFGGLMMSWDDANSYCERQLGSRLASIDSRLSNTEQNERIGAMKALAAAAGGYDVWIGLRWDQNSPEVRFYWTNGQPLIPTSEVGGTSVTDWHDGTPTPNPDIILGGSTARCVELWSQASYEWLNIDCNVPQPPTDIRACLCDRPDYFIGNENKIIPDTLNVQVTHNGSNSASVLAGGQLSFDVRGILGGADNQGLAGFSFDLSFDGGDLTQASVPPGMANFAAPNGYNNPDGFGGSVVAGDLIEVGGGQNTIHNTDAGGPTGTVVTGLGQTQVILASGTVTAPATPGTYTLSLSNLSATTINPGETGPTWKCEPAMAGTTTDLTITVLPCAAGDADNDGICDDVDPCVTANDDCASATAISDGTVTGCTVGATQDASASCAYSINSHDVWYLYTATCDGIAVASTCGAGTTFDTVLSVLDSCGGSELTCNDDGCGGFARTSLINWPVTTGGQYLIRVAGYGNATGDFEMNVSCSTNAANDNCANATPLAPGTYSGSTTNATNDGPGSCLTVASPDVWYVYTNDTGVDAEVTVDLCSPNTTFDTVLGVYGACGGSEIDCNDDDADVCAANEFASKLTWTVPCNATQWIQVSSYGPTPGDFELNFSVNPLPGTDSDGDGVGDACDVCPGYDDKIDTDKDGVPDGCDLCPGSDDALDADSDGIPDGCDNCPALDNPDQVDSEAPDAALDPLAVWHFDEDSGSTATDVFAGHVATLNGATWNSAGRAGAALEFPPGGATANVPNSADLGVLYQLSISLWVKPSAFPVTINRLVTRPTEIYVFRLVDDKPQFYVKQGGVLTGSRANVLIPANTWTHLAAVWDGLGDGVLRIYVNGVEAPSYDVQGTVFAPLDTSTAGLNLGNPGTERFEGLMDELGIFNRALSPSEIQALMSKGLGDGVGDVCDACIGNDARGDSDSDGVCDNLDVCPGFDDMVDSDGDGVPDGCDICPGFDDHADVDHDGVPDGCDICLGGDDHVDSDGDGVPDFCDICPGFDDNLDADGDGVPDGCDRCPGGDDRIDCQPNGTPDACDISSGTSLDANGNGIPDECEYIIPDPLAATGEAALTNRYLRFVVPAGASSNEVIRVRFVSLDGFPVPDPDVLYVGAPTDAPDENSAQPGLTFKAAPLVCSPYAHDWSAEGIVSVYGAEIMPGSTYEVQRADNNCPHLVTDETCWSTALTITTATFGDTVEPYDGSGPVQPDFSDIASLVSKFLADPSAPIKAVAQLQPNVAYPSRPIDFNDIAADVSAFLGIPYATAISAYGPCTCPSSVTCGDTPCANDIACQGIIPGGGDGLCVDGFCTDQCGRCTP